MRTVISLFVALFIFGVGVVYTLMQPKLYESRGLVDVSQNTSQHLGRGSLPTETTLSLLKSVAILTGVFERLTTQERERLVAPYSEQVGNFDDEDIIHCLYGSEKRSMQQIRDTNILEVSYRHPDPEMAAIVVDRYMHELIDYFLNLDKLVRDGKIRSIAGISRRLEQEKDKVTRLERDLATLEASVANNTESNSTQIDQVRLKLKESREYLDVIQATLSKVSKEQAIDSLRPDPIRIVEKASIPENHNSPNIPLWVCASFLAGLAGGVISFLLIGRIRTYVT